MDNLVKPKIYFGWDERELDVTAVAVNSLLKYTDPAKVNFAYLVMKTLVDQGIYTRPTEMRDNVLWDLISNAPMSTAHALTRFLVPHLNDYKGWALFIDSDIIFKEDVLDLFALAEDQYAIMCVKHNYVPQETIKKNNQPQLTYSRKNWSSVMLWNCSHPSNKVVTPDYVNQEKGRALHQFDWLKDHEIGELPKQWNYLVGIYAPPPKILHYTLGLPSQKGYEDCDYAKEWLDYYNGLKKEEENGTI